MTTINALAFVDKLDHWWNVRWIQRGKGGIAGGIKPAVDGIEVERGDNNDRHHNRLKAVAEMQNPLKRVGAGNISAFQRTLRISRRFQPAAGPPRQAAHQQPCRQGKAPKLDQVPRLVTPKHAPIGKAHARQITAGQHLLAKGNKWPRHKDADPHRSQRAQARQQGQDRQYATDYPQGTPAITLNAIFKRLDPDPRQQGHTQRKGKDPTEWTMQLAPPWQSIKEQTIKRRTKGKEQRENGKPHKEEQVYRANDLFSGCGCAP